jgi:hypothetical protein
MGMNKETGKSWDKTNNITSLSQATHIQLSHMTVNHTSQHPTDSPNPNDCTHIPMNNNNNNNTTSLYHQSIIHPSIRHQLNPTNQGNQPTEQAIWKPKTTSQPTQQNKKTNQRNPTTHQ